MIKFHYNTLAAPSIVKMEKQSNSTSERRILCAIPLLLLLSRLDASLKAHYSLWRKNNSLLIIGTSLLTFLYSGQFRSSIYIFLVTQRINKKRLFSKSGQEWTKFLLQGQWKIVLHHLLYRALVLHTNTYLLGTIQDFFSNFRIKWQLN